MIERECLCWKASGENREEKFWNYPTKSRNVQIKARKVEKKKEKREKKKNPKIKNGLKKNEKK